MRLNRVFDSDFSTLAFSPPEPLEAKTVDDAIIRTLVTNPRMMRQMPQVLRVASESGCVTRPLMLDNGASYKASYKDLWW